MLIREKDQETARAIIEKLKLEPLPFEGGYFRRTYECGEPPVSAAQLRRAGSGSRLLSTAIYYLVTPEGFSALHRVKSDEMFHFYAGDAVEMVQIDREGRLSLHKIGSDILGGEEPQVLVPKGYWQGLRLIPGGSWALMGTTVTPGFEYEDFELGSRKELTLAFPDLADVISTYTRLPEQVP